MGLSRRQFTKEFKHVRTHVRVYEFERTPV